MTAEIPTVKPVYLNAKLLHLRHSAHHRAMAPAPAQPGGQAGTEQPMLVLDFWGGMVRDEPGGAPIGVPLQTYEIFRDLGIATTENPRAQWEQATGQ